MHSTARDSLFNSSLDNLNICFVGGKGGTGKTTCAAAFALRGARRGRKTLIFSTDPAHSLSDIFNQKIGDKITPIEGIENLFGFEIDPRRRFREMVDEYRPAIDRVLREVGRGPISLEREALNSLFELTPPGLDELLGLEMLNEFLNAKEFDLIIVDTAAGAHTLRLLESPEVVEEYTGKILRILNRVVRRMGKGVPTKILAKHLRSVHELSRKIEELGEDAKVFISILRSPTTTFIPVTIPELMGVYVTGDMVNGIRKLGIRSDVIFVNYLIPSTVGCDFCLAKRKDQLKRVSEIREKFPGFEVKEVPLFPVPIRGKEALLELERVLFEGKELKPENLEIKLPKEPFLQQMPKLDLPPNIEFVLFGGKGGCGKTTCSAATGLWVAERGKKTLIVSADPQRSLSDILNQELPENEITPVTGVRNLYALEIGSETLFKKFKEDSREAILELAVGATSLERDEVESLMSLDYFPGMDEIMILKRVSELLVRPEYELIILDTAPTGHTFRFLEFPELFGKWAKWLWGVWTKTKHLIHRFTPKRYARGEKYKADSLLEELDNDRKRIEKAFKSHKTQFIPVTVLDELALAELEDLMNVLRSHDIHVEQIIVNKLASPRKCSYCMAIHDFQAREFSKALKTFREFKLVGAPYLPYEVQGIDSIRKFKEVLFESKAH